jgi:RNA polymerase sigma-70 factor (ECF subfamily)
MSEDGRPGTATEAFIAHRNLLFTVAYEMLGSAADAEDVLQETWLRWADVDLDTCGTSVRTWSRSPPVRRSFGCVRSAGARSRTSVPGYPSRC